MVGGINGLLAYASYGAAPDRTERSGRTAPGQYTESERRVIERLKARDREVRAHENAHKAAAGPHAKGVPKYTYTTGPDGKQYATGGSVAIDTSEVPGDPEKTLAKMEQVRAAALAPAEPSAQDARVAAEAAQRAAEARRELLQEKLSTREGTGSDQRVSQSVESAYARPERASRIDIRV